MKDWEITETKKRILKTLTAEQLSPRQIYGRLDKMGLHLSPGEFSELIYELFTENKIQMVKIDTSCLSQIKDGPNGILEAFFGAVAR